MDKSGVRGQLRLMIGLSHRLVNPQKSSKSQFAVAVGITRSHNPVDWVLIGQGIAQVERRQPPIGPTLWHHFNRDLYSGRFFHASKYGSYSFTVVQKRGCGSKGDTLPSG